jgi:ECF sigma factor
MMRRILVSVARKRTAEKRGGAGVAIELNESIDGAPMRDRQMIVLDDSMNALALIQSWRRDVADIAP